MVRVGAARLWVWWEIGAVFGNVVCVAVVEAGVSGGQYDNDGGTVVGAHLACRLVGWSEGENFVFVIPAEQSSSSSSRCRQQGRPGAEQWWN